MVRLQRQSYNACKATSAVGGPVVVIATGVPSWSKPTRQETARRSRKMRNAVCRLHVRFCAVHHQ